MNLIAPNDLFSVEFSFADTQRERTQLWNHPPPCSAVIRFNEKVRSYEDADGYFEFDAVDVEMALSAILQELPHLMNDDEGAH